MITANTYCAPNWVDLSTTDVRAACAFYEALFGWTIDKSPTPMGDYYMAKVAGHQVGGMMEANPEDDFMQPTWNLFFNVEDLDAMVETVTAAGGTIIQAPFEIPDARIAVVTDANGAMFGLFCGPEIEGTWMSRLPGAVCWVETMNRDLATAESFYASVFDWKADTLTTPEMSYTTFMLDGEPVAGMMQMPPGMDPQIPAHWSVYFTVTDCKQTVAKAVELGGEILKPVTETEMGPFAVIADPQGAVFQVMEFAA